MSGGKPRSGDDRSPRDPEMSLPCSDSLEVKGDRQLPRECTGLANHLRTFGHQSGIIINDDPDFVYIKVTKAAGTSILRHTLEKKPAHVSPYHLKDHRAKAQAWISEATDESLEKYYFFTVVRNPWDRFVSLASYVKVDVEELAVNFKKYMQNQNIRHHAHNQWIASHLPNGTQFADKICRIETLQDDMNEVFDALQLPHWEIPVKNTTQHKAYRDEISPQAREIISEIYTQDIEVFNYEF